MTILQPDALLDAPDPDQRAVVRQVTGPLAVLAGAGAGKTHAITYRIAYGSAIGAYPPDSVLAVTFVRRAAYEMCHRLAQLGVPRAQARTFHSAALRQLQHLWPTVIGRPLPQIVPHKASLVSSAAAHLGVTANKTMVRDLAAEVEWVKVSVVDSEHYLERVRSDHEPPTGMSGDDMARLLEVYKDARTERGVIDFGDILVMTCAMLQERVDITAKVHSQYRHFVVDELQDVSPLQRRLLDLWLGDHHDVCIIGDVAQTIYSFAGADPRHLVDFPEVHKDARVLELTRDYRSTPQVVSIANRLMAGAGPLSGAVHLKSQRPSGAAVSFSTYAGERAGAEGVAGKIEALITTGTRPHPITVLFRTNGQSQIFEEVLASRYIPLVPRGTVPLLQHENVRNALRVLLTAARFPASEDNGLVSQVSVHLEAVGWSDEAPSGGAAQERWSNLRVIVSWAEESQAEDLLGFVGELEEHAQYQVEPDQQGVELVTLHAAEGLEWDAVFLVRASGGLVPISYAKAPAAREEEQRLPYVGITRARNLLDTSWAKSKGQDSCSVDTRTRLFEGMWPRESTRRSAPTHARMPAKEAAHHSEKNARAEALALFESLKAWRKKVAALAGRPPYAIFTDQTLRDIALSQPDSRGELLAAKGIGEVKAEMFGEAVFALIRGENVEVGLDWEFAPEEGSLTDPFLQVSGPRWHRIRILAGARRSRRFSNRR